MRTWKILTIAVPAVLLAAYAGTNYVVLLPRCETNDSPEYSFDGRYRISVHTLSGGCDEFGKGYIVLQNSWGLVTKTQYSEGLIFERLGVKWQWYPSLDAVVVYHQGEGDGMTVWLLAHERGKPLIPTYDLDRLNLLIHYGEKRDIQNAIARKLDLNGAKDSGGLPLVTAAAEGDLDTVRLLLENGADINAKDSAGNTALHVSHQASIRDTAITELLVERGADVNARNKLGYTPLYTSVRTFPEVKYLVENGADVRAVPPDAAAVPFSSFWDIDIVEYLIEKGVTVDYQSPLVAPYLNYALIQNKVGLARFFEEHGANIEAAVRIRNGIDPLHYVAQNGHLEAVKYMVEHGADVNEKDEKGETPLDIVKRWLTADIQYRPRLVEVATYLMAHGGTPVFKP